MRNIGVLLSARDLNLKSVMGQGAAALKAFERSAQGVGQSLSASAAKAQAWRKVGTVMLATGGVIAAGLGLAIAAFARFDQQMSHVQAVTQASGREMELLRNQALRLGESTVFTANEVGQAQEAMAKAGFSTTQILSGLAGVLDLAAAGEMELATAAELTATTLAAFNLSANESTRVADTLAAGALTSAASMDDLALGLQQSAQMSNAFGLTVEEATGVLALFNQEGLRGSDAGTSLRTMLTRLIAPMGRGADELERLGVSMSDASGQMRPLGDIIDDLIVKWNGMTEAERLNSMSKIGGADAQRALIALYNEGVGGIDRSTAAVTQSGIAAEVAADKTDNLVGDVERLGGAFQSALIEGGSGANDALRFIVQTVTDAIGAFSSLPAPIQQAVMAFAGLTAVTLLVGGLTAKVIAMNTALAAAGPAGAKAAAGIRLMSTALGLLAIGVPAIIGLNAALEAMFSTAADSEELERLARDLDRFGGASTRAQQNMLERPLGDEFDKLERAIRRVTAPSLGNQLQDLGANVFTLGGLITDAGTDLGDAKQDIEDFNKAIEELAKQDPRAAGEAYKAALDLMIERGIPAKDAFAQLADARKAVFEGNLNARAVTGPVGEVEDAAAQAEQAVSDLGTALGELFLGPVSLQQAADDVASAINDLRGSVTGATTDFSNFTPEAIANRDAVASVSAAMRDQIQAMADAGATQDQMVAKNNANIAVLQALKAEFPQLGPVIDAHIEALQGIPAAVSSTIGVVNNTGPTMSEAEARLKAWNASRGIATVDAYSENAHIRIAAAKDKLFDWDASSGTSDIKADDSNAKRFQAAADARRRAWDASSGTSDVRADDRNARAVQAAADARRRAWDRSSGTADVNARDNASNVISRVGALLAGLHDKTITITTIHRMIQQGVAAINPFASRMGNIFPEALHAQSGLLQAGIVGSPTVMFGERVTGGEAFIPRYGNPNRSRAILAQAANWYGMELRPQGSGGGGGRGDVVFQTIITNQINAKSILNEKTLVEAIQETTRFELREHDRKMLRSLKSH